MEKKAIKSRLAGIPAWALSLMTFFATIGLFELFEHITIPDSHDSFDTELILVSLMYVIFLTAACLIICKAYPKSVWSHRLFVMQ